MSYEQFLYMLFYIKLHRLFKTVVVSVFRLCLFNLGERSNWLWFSNFKSSPIFIHILIIRVINISSPTGVFFSSTQEFFMLFFLVNTHIQGSETTLLHLISSLNLRTISLHKWKTGLEFKFLLEIHSMLRFTVALLFRILKLIFPLNDSLFLKSLQYC